MSLELLLEVSLPDKVKDEVILASLISVERQVVLNSDLMEHV